MNNPDPRKWPSFTTASQMRRHSTQTLRGLEMMTDRLLEEQDGGCARGDLILRLIKFTRTLLDVTEDQYLKGVQRMSQLPEGLSAELGKNGHIVDPEVLRRAFDRWTVSKEREETVSRAN